MQDTTGILLPGLYTLQDVRVWEWDRLYTVWVAVAVGAGVDVAAIGEEVVPIAGVPSPPVAGCVPAEGVSSVNPGVLVAEDGKAADCVDFANAVCVDFKMSAMICGCVATGNGIASCVAVGTTTGTPEAERSQALKSRLLIHSTTNKPKCFFFMGKLLIQSQVPGLPSKPFAETIRSGFSNGSTAKGRRQANPGTLKVAFLVPKRRER